MNLASLIGTVLSVALGFALQVSGFGGPVAQIVAWAFVAVVALTSLWLYLRRRPSGSLRKALSTVFDLGHEIESFVRLRTRSAPPPAPQRRLVISWRGREGTSRSASDREVYDADTMSLFEQQFSEPLASVVERLRKLGRLGHAEANSLMTPATPTEIEELARRFIELSSQVE